MNALIHNIAVMLCNFGLWIFDELAPPCREWDDEDWQNYRKLKKLKQELQTSAK